jgi:ribosomal protein S18 acetylase RimI-like enzyme
MTGYRGAPPGVQIFQASGPEHLAAVRSLFQEYAASIGIDLCFQGFADELANLPGSYAPQRGRLMVAWVDDAAAGCVGLRPLDDGVCELKRMYVRPAFRGQGLGKRLAETIIAEARQIGYRCMRLDTLPSMTAATRLYGSLGFVRRNAYYDTPLPDTIFMELHYDDPWKSYTDPAQL